MTGSTGEEQARGGAASAALSPFFTSDEHDRDVPPGEPWRPMQEILDDGQVLDERVAAVRAFLAAGSGQDTHDVEVRVAASVVQLGLVARLASPLFARALTGPGVDSLTLREVFWQPQLGGVFPLSLPRPLRRARPADSDVAEILGAVLVDGLAAALGRAVARFGVSDRITQGNTASALAGAAHMFGEALPEHRAAARALLDLLLSRPALLGSGHHLDDGSFRRRSCCLIYRATPGRDGQLCGDCVLQAVPRHRDSRG